MSNSHFGKCALCRQECELSFEHIPPRSAFNYKPVKSVTGDKILNDPDRMPWDTDGLEYSNQQRGMGKFSLCDSCNKNTGRWYGTAYKRMAQAGHLLLSDHISPDENLVIVKDIYPLRFIKQVISMFCSVNSIEDDRLPELRQFVLNQQETGLDKSKYKLCMYFTKSRYRKYAPLSIIINDINGAPICTVVSEITAYPLGFTLFFNPTDALVFDGVDITGFADFGYDEKADIGLPICILEMNDLLPTFYRTQEEIIHTVNETNEWKRLNDNDD